jgi:hypothetical protein
MADSLKNPASKPVTTRVYHFPEKTDTPDFSSIVRRFDISIEHMDNRRAVLPIALQPTFDREGIAHEIRRVRR